jgi:hypothetical protein
MVLFRPSKVPWKLPLPLSLPIGVKPSLPFHVAVTVASMSRPSA